MYLVCYNLKNYDEKNEGTRYWQLGRALLGPTAHCEIGFVTDFDCEGFLITARCPDGLPVFVQQRTYEDHDGKYEIVFYQFKDLTYRQRRIVRKKCTEIIKENKYKLSMIEMMASTFPRRFTRLYKWAIYLIFGELDYQLEYPPPYLPIYCVTLSELVLKEIYPKLEIPQQCNASDFVVHLLRQNIITKCNQRPDVNSHLIGKPSIFTRASVSDYII